MSVDQTPPGYSVLGFHAGGASSSLSVDAVSLRPAFELDLHGSGADVPDIFAGDKDGTAGGAEGDILVYIDVESDPTSTAWLGWVPAAGLSPPGAGKGRAPAFCHRPSGQHCRPAMSPTQENALKPYL